MSKSRLRLFAALLDAIYTLQIAFSTQFATLHLYWYILCIFAIYGSCCKHAENMENTNAITLLLLLLVEASRIRLQIFSIFADSCNLKVRLTMLGIISSPICTWILPRKKVTSFPKSRWTGQFIKSSERVYKAEVR